MSIRLKVFDKCTEAEINTWLQEFSGVPGFSIQSVLQLDNVSRPKNKVSLLLFYRVGPAMPAINVSSVVHATFPCSECGSAMIKRFRKSDNAPFWGCAAFPNCRTIEDFNEADVFTESGDGDNIPF